MFLRKHKLLNVRAVTCLGVVSISASDAEKPGSIPGGRAMHLVPRILGLGTHPAASRADLHASFLAARGKCVGSIALVQEQTGEKSTMMNEQGSFMRENEMENKMQNLQRKSR